MYPVGQRKWLANDDCDYKNRKTISRQNKKKNTKIGDCCHKFPSHHATQPPSSPSPSRPLIKFSMFYLHLYAYTYVIHTHVQMPHRQTRASKCRVENAQKLGQQPSSRRNSFQLLRGLISGVFFGPASRIYSNSVSYMDLGFFWRAVTPNCVAICHQLCVFHLNIYVSMGWKRRSRRIWKEFAGEGRDRRKIWFFCLKSEYI